MRLVVIGGLDDDLEIGSEAHDGRDRIGGAGDHGSFEKENLSGDTLHGVLEALEVVGFGDDHNA
jgi:hypothetical protein